MVKKFGGIVGVFVFLYVYCNKIDKKINLKEYEGMVGFFDLIKFDYMMNVMLVWKWLFRVMEKKYLEVVSLFCLVGVLEV